MNIFKEKAGDNFKNKFFILVLPLSFLVVLTIDFTEWVFISFLVGCSDWCGIQLIYYPIYIFPICIIYWLMRINNLKFSESNLYNYLVGNVSKIFKIILFILFIIYSLMSFDYFTRGKYLKISNETNISYWLEEAIKADDVVLCDFIESNKFKGDADFCYKQFFVEYKVNDFKKYNFYNNTENIQIIYNNLIKDQCGFLADKYYFYCEESVLVSIKEEFKQELLKNTDSKFLKYAPDIGVAKRNGNSGIIMSFDGSKFKNQEDKYIAIKSNLSISKKNIKVDNNLRGDIYITFTGKNKNFKDIYKVLNESVYPVLDKE